MTDDKAALAAAAMREGDPPLTREQQIEMMEGASERQAETAKRVAEVIDYRAEYAKMAYEAAHEPIPDRPVLRALAAEGE